ncbi:AAA family ATPase [Lentzea chajnantorensis]
MNTADRLRTITTELAGQFLERAEVVRALVVALLAKQHALLLGPPGTAKSQLARELTSRVDGARYWEVLMTKFTDPKKLFGPVDVAALTQGVYQQVFDGRATRAEVAFIDEVFKASAASLNELLTYLNERLYHPEAGGDPIACPLVSAITASNELPSGQDDLSAIFDRLLVRVEVEYLTDPTNFAALIRSAVVSPAQATRTTVDLADLLHAVDVEVPAVKVPDSVVDAICKLRMALRRAELVVSDRRWRQCVSLLQASAYLDGRDEVNESDLRILTTALWDSPSQRPLVNREVLTLIDPDAKKALDQEDAINDLDDALNALAGQSQEKINNWAIKEGRKKAAAAGKELEAMRAAAVADGRTTATVDRVIARQRAVLARILVEALGIDPSMVNV